MVFSKASCSFQKFCFPTHLPLAESRIFTQKNQGERLKFEAQADLLGGFLAYG